MVSLRFNALSVEPAHNLNSDAFNVIRTLDFTLLALAGKVSAAVSVNSERSVLTNETNSTTQENNERPL